MTEQALIIWLVVLFILFAWIDFKPSLQRTEKGDIVVFITHKGKRKYIVLWWGRN